MKRTILGVTVLQVQNLNINRGQRDRSFSPLSSQKTFPGFAFTPSDSIKWRISNKTRKCLSRPSFLGFTNPRFGLPIEYFPFSPILHKRGKKMFPFPGSISSIWDRKSSSLLKSSVWEPKGLPNRRFGKNGFSNRRFDIPFLSPLLTPFRGYEEFVDSSRYLPLPKSPICEPNQRLGNKGVAKSKIYQPLLAKSKICQPFLAKSKMWQPFWGALSNRRFDMPFSSLGRGLVNHRFANPNYRLPKGGDGKGAEEGGFPSQIFDLGVSTSWDGQGSYKEDKKGRQVKKPKNDILMDLQLEVEGNSIKIHSQLKKNSLIPKEYNLEKYHRSNQDTCMVHRPAVFEGDWVQSGDLLADSSASQNGELTLGRNILIAYMPWEGYNYEDAILISERLVYDDLYTSIHIEKYEIDVRDTKYGTEEITKEIPDIGKKELSNLDKNGIIKVGSWVEEGDILVGKITPIPKKSQSPYQKLLYTILEKKFLPVRDTSLRAPKGIKAKVIEIQSLFGTSSFSKKQKANKKQAALIHSGPQSVHIYLADKRRVQVGDKMAGRHGNKGIISQILPRQDMPYLPDGTVLDMVLNPLGVPSRMNVGQIYECLLGLAGKYLGEHFRVTPFDEIYGAEASRSLAYSKLYEARQKTGNKWLFHPYHPGKIRIFDGRTGEGFDQAVTVGVAYMLKLVHLVDDKIHCLTPDHDVLTEQGWIPISEVKTIDKVASLNADNQLVYTSPTKVWHYDNYNGKLYHIENQQINLTVTMNHRMWVSTVHTRKEIWSDYKFIEAEQLVGKHVKYLKSAEWVQPDFQFYLPNSDLVFPMDVWLTFFGLWIAEGWTQTTKLRTNYGLVMLAQVKPSGRNRIENLLQTLGLNYRTSKEKYIITYQPLYQYLKKYSFVSVETVSSKQFEILDEILETEMGHSSDVDLQMFRYSLDDLKILNNKYPNIRISKHLTPELFEDVDLPDELIQNGDVTSELAENIDQQLFVYRSYNKSLPDWVWRCSQQQCRVLLHGLVLGDGSVSNITSRYYTSSIKLAGDVMRLALHAGWSGNVSLHQEAGRKCGIIRGKQVVAVHALYRVGINKTKNNPAVNHGHHQTQQIQKELVYDYQGSVYCLEVPHGVFMVRKEGKAVWTGNSRSTGPYSLVTQQPLRGRSKHGGQRLGEMEVWALEGYGAAFVLLEMLTIKSDDISGRMALWSNIILDKEIYIGTPESFKVLVCELQALCLDIGIFRLDSKGVKKQIEQLIKLS